MAEAERPPAAQVLRSGCVHNLCCSPM